ncbi:MAG: hypothetical protein Q4C12_08755 [Clostridia bacterium]|nr:hypothetical protein [Clostridia bacterium]
MKETYDTPVITIDVFETSDIITASGALAAVDVEITGTAWNEEWTDKLR